MGIELVLVRHGQTDWNYEKRTQGRVDIPLNDAGIRQAERLKKKIVDFNFTHCYSSPLKRARKTAEIVVDGRLPIVFSDKLVERCFGDAEGVVVNKESALFKRDIGDLNANYSDNGLESIRDLLRRAEDFLDEIRENHKDGDRIIIFSHGSFLRALHFAIEGYDNSLNYWSWGLDNCEYAEEYLR